MKGLAAAFLSAVAAGIFHCLISFCAKSPAKKEPIRAIIYQLRLISVLWTIGAVLFFFLFSKLSFLGGGLSWLARAVIDYGIGLIMFGFLFFLYISVYYIFDRSVSSDIMIAIERSDERRLTLAQIEELYGTERQYEDSLRGMREGGFILEETGIYRNTLKGALFSFYASFFKKIYKVGLGGY